MDEQEELSPEEFFPTIESFPDFSGERREFVIELEIQSRGYFLRANERRTDGEAGYTFGAYAPGDPFFARGQLRDRIRRGLATRYLIVEHGRRALSHDRLKGTIGFGGVIVDGEFITFQEFCSILDTYEGFQFSLTTADPYDEA